MKISEKSCTYKRKHPAKSEMTEVESVAALPEEEPEQFDDVSDDDIDSLFGPA